MVMVEMMKKLIKDTNEPWLQYADDYQSDCAFIYFWFNNLEQASEEFAQTESTVGGTWWLDRCQTIDDFFKAGLDASPDYQRAVEIWTAQSDPTIVREFWADKKWQWVKFWTATDDASADSGGEEFRKDHRKFTKSVRTILESPIESKFIEFADPWIDVKDTDAVEEFHNKHWETFKAAWIREMMATAPTDGDIFGDIWNLDAPSDPTDDIKDDEPEDQDEKPVRPKYELSLGGTPAWVSEVDGEIKLSKNSPGDEWILIESVNTGVIKDGEILFVPSYLEGAVDWWIGLGNSESDIKRLSKTKIIISGAGDFSKSWLRRYFFVKDKDGDLVISY